MDNSIKSVINARNELITKTAEEIEKKLEDLPGGRINVKRRKNGSCYYHVGNGGSEKYLNDDDLIRKLIQKGYLEKVLKASKEEAAALKKALEKYPKTVAEDIFDHLSEERKKFVRPIVIGDEEYTRRWQEQLYKKKPISDDLPVYMTMRGERVRSKSEIIIADRLYASGIPYKYECPLKVGDKIIHPDFTILRMSDRNIIYHEHCGMMDYPEYAEDMVKRINDYSEEGIIQGDRLFLSFETSSQPLDARVIDGLINTHFR